MAPHLPEPTISSQLRTTMRHICAAFPPEYWRECDQQRAYPTAFVDAMTGSRMLSALIPAEYGGLGMTMMDASVILEEVNRSGGNSAACHAQMYTMGAMVRHGSEEQKSQWLPPIATGEMRLQAFSVTEHEAGSETTAIATSAVRQGNDYLVNGHKNWTSRIEQSDLMLLLARTSSRDQIERRSDGLSLLLVDLEDARAQHAIDVRPVRTMFNYATNEVTYRNLRVPAANLIGKEGDGFRCALDGMNAERILLAAEAIGDGYWFIEQAAKRASEREVFDRPIGANQGVQFPIARAHAAVVAADQVRYLAASKYDTGESCGAEANMAKLLASEASWQAANVCLDTFGGYGFVTEYDVERKFRETRLYQVAPVSNNLVLAYLAHHVLGMPKSY
ncbi:acyl-CoA dehydrogenase family protein [soil metagenome]